ncbi:MAG: hypothetical protein HY650_10460 [Acidobacteria bacterium]|nr:hypothetical protein [Acidobacteriota bacterium]
MRRHRILTTLLAAVPLTCWIVLQVSGSTSRPVSGTRPAEPIDQVRMARAALDRAIANENESHTRQSEDAFYAALQAHNMAVSTRMSNIR